MPDRDAPFDPAAVPISPAATVMLLRDGDQGLEVFVLRRTGLAAFAGNAYVFPGGRIDDVDHADELEEFCDGLDDGTASERLGIDHGGLAYWVGAVRECLEEAGVLVGRSRGGGPVDLDGEDRRAVHDGSLSMIDLCRRRDVVIDLTRTYYVSHWITPKGERRRFDTRFFVAPAPPDQEPVHDDSETVASEWVRPADAIQRHRAGELMMLPPTIANLQWLADFADVGEALDAARDIGEVECVLPKIVLGDDGSFRGIVRPGEPGYDELPD